MPSQIVEGFLLSPQQEHLWLLGGNRRAKPFGAYRTCRIVGPLEVRRLEMALQVTVQRHEILRTAFQLQPGMTVPLQVITQGCDHRMRYIDLSALDMEARQAGVEAVVREAMQLSCDPEEGAPLQACLMAFSPTEHLLLVHLLSLCGDDTTLDNLLREVGRSYEECAGEHGQAEEPLQYADVAQAFRQLLESEESEVGRQYWLSQGLELQTSSLLPVEERPAADAAFEPRCCELVVEPAALSRIREVAQGYGVSVKAFLFTCWQLLLRRLTSQPDLMVAAAFDGRRYEGLDLALGLFARHLPVPSPWQEGEPFVDLLQRTEKSLETVFKWQESFSWDLLSEKPAGLRFWPFSFDFVQSLGPFSAGGLMFLPVAGQAFWDRFKLRLSIVQRETDLLARFEYDAGTLQAVEVGRTAAQFRALLGSCLECPESPGRDLDLLDETERHRVLVGFNDCRFEHQASARLLHQLIAEQAGRAPDSTAVVFGDSCLSYRELDRRANRLAHRLRDEAGPEVYVAVCMDRSLDLIICLLAILKSGSAYLPLDPEYPEERWRFMAADSGARVLLTDAARAARLLGAGGRVIVVDSRQENHGSWSDEEPQIAIDAGNPAYAIYTSGSTGRPKGVVISHAAILNRLLWMQRVFPLSAADRVLQKTPYGFDASVWELFSPLLAGGQLVLAEAGAHRDSARLIELVASHQVTRLQLVPSFLGPVLEEPGLATCGSLTHLFCGGEALPCELRERFFDRSEGVLCNLYGPTEAAIDASFHVCRRGKRSGIVPIGRPLDNVRIHVLEPGMRPVPIGLPGVLHIGGAGLARGYLGRPDLTAERFLPDPFSTVPGERLYTTGDLARYLPDGTLEYLGRTDQQVKIRGFRIELGEIETVLLEHPAVGEAAVVPWQEPSGAHRLVAYVVTARGQETVPPQTLASYLKERLPEYMVPAVFAPLALLPRMPNGKIDRRALPAPDRLAASAARAYEEPRGSKEQLLAKIWSEILGVERIGRHDNFFELGGDSILSIQVVSRANKAGLKLTAQQLFASQTIARSAEVAEAGSAAPAGEDRPLPGRLPLSPAQHWFLDRDPIDAQHYNQAVMLEVLQPLLRGPLEQALQTIHRHHDAFRLRFEKSGQGWQQTLAGPEGDIPLAWIDLSRLSAEVCRAALEEAAAALQGSLDLLQGPLARVAFFDLGGSKPGRLLLIVHHLVVDGFSWRILLEDLETAYRQASQGQAIQVPAATTPFSRWTEKLAQFARSMPVEPELSWWMREVEGDLSRVPVDHPGAPNTEASARVVPVWLSAEETRILLQEVPAAYHTQINDVLLTALAQALGASGRPLLVELEAHGREGILPGVDLARTIGWFTTSFPVRLDGMADPDFASSPGTALKTIKEHLREIPRKGIGYGLLRFLREEGTATGPLANLEYAEVSFNYLGQFDHLLSQSSQFGVARESSGPLQSPRALRRHLLEVIGIVAEGQLRVDWIYSSNLHSSSAVERMAEKFLASLKTLISHCRFVVEQGIGGYTPSDFPLAGLDQKLLDRLLREEAAVEDLYPLCPLQEGLLFHGLYEPGSGAYIAQLLCTMHGELDPRALRESFQQIVERNSALRTSFRWQGLQRPLQVVHRHVEVVVTELDWRHLPAESQAQHFDDLLRADREQELDLAQAPLMRWTLVRTGEREHRLLWTQHHLLSDGWSFGILVGDFLETYESLRNGAEPQLPRRPPYRDYIAWLQQIDLSRTERFWREYLAGWNDPTPLPESRLAGLHDQQGTTWHHQRFPAAATAMLQAQVRKHQLTLNTVLQGVWGALLGRYSGREEVVFGTTVSGRPADLPGVEAIVGLFINTLPVRLDISGRIPLLTWLQDVQRRQSELREHEHSPLVKIRDWSDVARGRPLFESIFVFENYPRGTGVRPGGSGLDLLEVQTIEQTHYPLTMVAGPGDELLLSIEYDDSRFDASSVSRLLVNYCNLLEGIARRLSEGTEGTLAEVSMLSAGEVHQLLWEWNDTESDYPWRRDIQSLFEEQAELRPAAVAAVFEDVALTYGELNRRANRLAYRLLRHGVEPGDLVGLYVERSLDMVVALVGILKAGAAYLPLDPTYPAERLAFILEDTGVEILLAQANLQGEFLPPALKVMRIDEGGAEATPESEENPRSAVGPDSLAYVIYTSGSTGLPKGVAIPHRGVVRLVRETNYIRLDETDHIAQASNISFDAATFEIWGALLNGGSLVGIPLDVLLSPHRFTARLIENQISVLFLTTALFNQIVREVPGAFRTLRCLLFGGEAVDPVLVRRALVNGPPQRLLHVYGPTESTTFSSWFHVEEVSEGAATVPIGRPVANTRIYLLDPYLQPVPVGVQGELYIAGDGLAREYLNRPELTAERFVESPALPGQRLYKTGDLVSWSTVGTLEFHGRTDNQVKIRGFRVELEEIERVLITHPRVREAVVLAYDDEKGERSLAACVVLLTQLSERSLTPGDLRAHLKTKLPEYMVPAVFVFLDALPLNRNGKVDRHALPVPDRALSAAREDYVAPRDPVEAQLAAIWSEVLQVDRVGVSANFFELGGHSLSAIRVVLRINEAFGVDVPIRALFLQPTIEELAGSIETIRRQALSEAELDHEMAALQEEIRQLREMQEEAI